jgi:hypothetical protein
MARIRHKFFRDFSKEFMESRNNSNKPTERDATNNRLEGFSSIPGDLPDSEKDKEALENEETFIDLPDVKDIPGQEFVNTPPVGSIGGPTIASDDEEGRGVFDVADSEDFTPGTDGDVSLGERKALEHIDYMPTEDEDRLVQAAMDSRDFQGEKVEEAGFGQAQRTGDDLDVPGSKDQTPRSAMGQGDEENKYHSLGSIHNDSLNESMDEKADYKDIDEDDVPVNNG